MKPVNNITTDQVKILNNNLRYGDYSKIARILGCSYMHVSNVMKGIRKDEEVVLEAFRFIKEREARIKQMRKAVEI